MTSLAKKRDDGEGDMTKLAGEYYKAETPRASAGGELKVKIDDKDEKHDTNSESSADSDKKKKEGGPPGKKRGPPKSFKFSQLYRYATLWDKVLITVGVVMAIANGALFPLMAVVFGNVLGGFSTIPIDHHAINTAALNYLFIATGMFFTDYLLYVSFYHSAERQMKALRGEALKHMLYLDISWYDKNDALQLSSRLTGDTVKIKAGMGQKLGDMCRFTTTCVVGFIIGFVRGWDIALAMACVMPVMAISLAWLIKTLTKRAEWAQKVYAQAGAVAEETLGSIRTIASLNGEKRAILSYREKIAVAEKENIALHKIVSIVFAMFLGSVWVMYSIGLWYGGKKVSDGKAEPGHVFTAFFAILTGTASLAQISPNISAVAEATGAALELYRILDTKSEIDASKDEGIIPDSCEGAIEAIDINFTYPGRPDAQILKNYNVKIAAGETVAFVGSSGGGKSTLISLLERFYDPTSGTLLLDGRDVKTLNVRWLRSQIGLVSQEPVLFATTIFENIAAGGENITREQVIEAAKLSNAHNFIMSLPENYDTLVGEKGLSLSGGQKQRVAIARAIVRQPKILVLDEATSALDAESERVVQAALNNLMEKTQMTTLVIAHRLSTIRHADKIFVLNDGHIVESGSHDEIVQIEDGIYRNMYTIQQLRSKEEEEAAALEADEEGRLVHRSSFVSTKTDISLSDVENNELEKKKFGMVDIARFCKPDWRHFVFGMIGSAFAGIAMPASALLVSGMITSMTMGYANYQKTQDHSYLDKIYDDVMVYGILYLVGAAFIMLFVWMQSYCFKYISERLTTRLRNTNFEALCHQNIGFFDAKENATGALIADLATNATKVALLSGDSQARVFQAMFTMIAALVIAFGLGSWLLTLIMLAVFPLLVLGHVIRMKQIHGRGAIADELADTGAHSSEVLTNIRTVVALGIEKSSSDKYMVLLEAPMKKGKTEAQINGIALGFSSFIMMATYSLVFWYGAKLVNDGDITFKQMIRTTMALMMSIQGVSGAASYFGDSETAYKSGSNIISLRERKVPIDAFEESGLRPTKVEGKIEFKDITFRYPTRKEVTVLKNYNLTIEAGQTVAFCGPSGGGKSTCISLIERFYDPIRGEVLLDGNNLKDLNLSWLRSQIGLVGQEPTLFIGTIAENISYGIQTKPSQDEIEAAAKMANAHDFITRFPDGYETQVGMKGEQLSGGQKQRIAIARAILKNPEILLLDEATSALDSESEKVVQEALDKVVSLKRRTTIIIAHRLSTIRKADKICVVSGGRIAEQGTHSELLALNGLYARLVESASS
ncbi:Multidrug resistance protein abc superfamily, partial [Globisporangium splendens]